MTAPRRLIEADDEFERDLIRSAHDDRPSQRALERLLSGLGGQLSKLPSSAPGVATSGKIGGVVLAKWLLAGVAVGLATIGAAEATGRALEHRGRHADEGPRQFVRTSPTLAASSEGVSLAAPREGPLSMPQDAPSALVPGARLRGAASPVPIAAAAPTPLASSAIASSAIASAPPVATAPSPSATSPGRPAVGSFALQPAEAPPTGLAQEMRLLDAARRALASGAPQSALATLATYERAFQNGVLRPEASVLKVRALLAAGDRAGAAALGQQVIEQAPHGEHAVAVRAALGLRSNP